MEQNLEFTRQIILTFQLIDIASFCVYLIFIAVYYSRKKYSLYYALIRKIIYKDSKPMGWFYENPIYFYCIFLLFSIISAEAGMIQQISDGSVYTKPFAVLIGYLGIAIFTMFIMLEFIKEQKLNKNGKNNLQNQSK